MLDMGFFSLAACNEDYREMPEAEQDECCVAYQSRFLAAALNVSQYALSLGDMTPRRIEFEGRYMYFRPSQTGFPTYRDYDIMLYCQCWLGNATRGERMDDVTEKLEFDVEDFYEFSGRARRKDRDDAFVQALDRLTGSTFQTNTRPFGLDSKEVVQKYLKEYELVRDEKGRIKTVTVRVPHRMCVMFENDFYFVWNKDFLTLSPIHRMITMFVIGYTQEPGEVPKLTVTFERLHQISCSSRDVKYVPEMIKNLVAGQIPDISVEVDEKDKTVTFTRLRGVCWPSRSEEDQAFA